MTDTYIINEISRSTIFIGGLLTIGIVVIMGFLLLILDELRKIRKK